VSATGDVLEAVQEELRGIREAQAQLAERLRRLEELFGQLVTTALGDEEGALDAEDLAMLADEEIMRHVDAAREAHRRARAGEDVDWPRVIRDHIIGGRREEE